jgi:hypothetical protein
VSLLLAVVEVLKNIPSLALKFNKPEGFISISPSLLSVSIRIFLLVVFIQSPTSVYTSPKLICDIFPIVDDELPITARSTTPLRFVTSPS